MNNLSPKNWNAPDKQHKGLEAQHHSEAKNARNEKQQARIEQNNNPKQKGEEKKEKLLRVTLCWWMNEWTTERHRVDAHQLAERNL